ncbi:hypothetical protein DL93DRAFT_2173832 [Clavulina sp. PMI_390]|nr:hypothetical protein DL93DRAFT_2173832 [Clavulina sp. PMI_390]
MSDTLPRNSRLFISPSYGFSITISPNCTSAIADLALSPEGNCLYIGGLIQFGGLGVNDSIITPVDNFLDGFCTNFTGLTTSGRCTNASVLDLGQRIIDSCGADMITNGVPSAAVQSLPNFLVRWFNVGGEALCTRDENENDQHCVVEALTALECSLKTNLTTSTIMPATSDLLINTTLQNALACNSCAQNAYALVRPQLGNLTVVADTEYEDICGTKVANTTKPAGIIVATNSLAASTGTVTSSIGSAANVIATFILSQSYIRDDVALKIGDLARKCQCLKNLNFSYVTEYRFGQPNHLFEMIAHPTLETIELSVSTTSYFDPSHRSKLYMSCCFTTTSQV